MHAARSRVRSARRRRRVEPTHNYIATHQYAACLHRTSFARIVKQGSDRVTVLYYYDHAHYVSVQD